MVATQMLPRFSGSIASSFIPSSNQPPSVYTARTFKEWDSWGIRAGPAQGWGSPPLAGKRGGKRTSLERAGVLRRGTHPRPRAAPHLLEQVGNSITVDFPEGGMVGHVAAPLFWGSGRGSKGEKGAEGRERGRLHTSPRNVQLRCARSGLKHSPRPHPDQNTEQQELSVGTRQPPRRRLFPRDTGEGGACSP